MSKALFKVKVQQLEDPFTSLLPFGVWPEEPYEIDFFDKKRLSKNIRIVWEYNSFSPFCEPLIHSLPDFPSSPELADRSVSSS